MSDDFGMVPASPATMMPATDARMPLSHPAARTREWDEYAEDWVSACPQPFWRAHSDAVNSDLVSRWLPPGKVNRILKTDLFDEAVAAGLYRAIADRCVTAHGIDVSRRIVGAAGDRYPLLQSAEADVRHLPFDDSTIDAVVSISTLDHFATSAEIGSALAEIRRVLKPGGTLVLTLDNLANPVVALRNALPYSLTHAAGLVPYPVGKTHGPRGARRLVEASGLKVVECTAIMHSPRVLAVPFARFIEKRGTDRLHAAVSKAFLAFERLRPLPTAYLTGHFVAIRAIRAA